ncbi:MAG: acyltransferase, partial [Enhydrobacter sp.]
MFHAVPGVVPSGFYGVDVFFVISGYLISGIILRELDERRFSFLDFYSRRVRRIVPALLVVLLTGLAIGWIVLLPGEFSDLGKNVVAAAVFLSNFLLWTSIDYFDLAIDQKPLMHLWSLGVEEQFYVAWPLLLVATRAWRKSVAAIAIVVLASFALMVWATTAHSIAAFYLPMFRFW